MHTGGFGMYVTETALEQGLTPPAKIFAVKGIFPGHGSHRLLMQDAGLDPESMAAVILHQEQHRGKESDR